MATTAIPADRNAPTAQRRALAMLILLLALATFINALDRGNFSVAAPKIKDELGLDNTQIGVLISAFYWTYVPGHFLSGWLSERVGAYRTLTLGLGIWSVATLITGLVGGFAALLMLRLLLGLGESTGWPATSKLLATHIPQGKLASANAMTAAGLNIGNGAGIFIGGLLIAEFGWRALFVVFGTLSLLWLVPWLTFRRPIAASETPFATIAPAGPSFAQLLSKREMWGAALGHFAANYPYFLVLLWLPLYLVKQQGYSLVAMAWIGGTVYIVSAIVGVIAGRISDSWIGRGGDISRVRKTMMLASAFIGLGCMIACALGGPRIAVVAFLMFGVANGLGAFSVFSIGQTLAGPRAAGKWMGVQNGVGGMAGVLSPIITGWSIDVTGDYRIAFFIAAGIAAFGAVCWGLVIPRIAPIDWDER